LTIENSCMLSRDQIETLLLIRKREGTILYNTRTPKPIINLISNIGDVPNSDIATLLHHVAFGELEQVKGMLEKNPRLLLEAGNVEDPAGNTIVRVTPYECALGAGDDEMAGMMDEYFKKFEGGDKARLKQYARFKTGIEQMLDEKNAFDFGPLLQIIIESKNEDVTAALNLDFNHHSPLQHVLEDFRKHFLPREIHRGMHFNYATLLKAFEVYDKAFDTLIKAGRSYDKCDLFWRQVIGYIQRGLPACDRQAFAQGIFYINEKKEKLQRHFNFRFVGCSFPITSAVDSCSGLGYEYGVGHWSVAEDGRRHGALYIEAYVKQKQQTCRTYAATSISDVSVCNFMN
ncbi:TPA: hypothetical protein ACF2P2_002989, partial [Legionella pneumophila]